MTGSSSGTIDGIDYASSQYVYDNRGDGVVLDIFYYDQSGTAVAADQTLYQFGQLPHGAPVRNADGTFSIAITPAGAAQPIEIDTFSSDGIWIRKDDYGSVYPDPHNPSSGAAGYGETGYTLINSTGSGSSGSVDGNYYDTVEATYTPSGRLAETDYYNTLDTTHTLVERVYSPNPSLSLVPTGTAAAGTADTLYAGFTDPWAAQQGGGVTLTISVDAGVVTGRDANGNGFTATAAAPVHLSGTAAQINSDLSSLSFLDRNAGTAHLTLQVYDQSGASATATQTIAVGGGGTGSSSPDPVIGGPSSVTIPADVALHALTVTFSDPWAANHAGSLALNVTTTIGTLTDLVNGLPVAGGTSFHLTGTYSQIETDLAGLNLAANQTGTGVVRLEIYDQSGTEAVHLIGVTTQAPVSAS